MIAVHVKDGPIKPGTTSRQMPTDQAAGRHRATSRWPPRSRPRRAREYAVIEFDHYEGDVFAGIGESYAWLSTTLGK